MYHSGKTHVFLVQCFAEEALPRQEVSPCGSGPADTMSLHEIGWRYLTGAAFARIEATYDCRRSRPSLDLYKCACYLIGHQAGHVTRQ